MGDKLDPSSRTQAESAVKELKDAMAGEDVARIRQASEKLNQIAHTMAQAAYQQNAQTGNAHQQPGNRNSSSNGKAGAGDDDVVDADFEEVA